LHIGSEEADVDDPDRIERELTLRAPIDHVWRSLTGSEQVSRWFGTHTEIDLRPGGAALFVWGPTERFHAVVEAVEPPHRFVYRWCQPANTPVETGPTTLVEFELEEVPEGTRLRMVESGFAAHPDVERGRDEHEEGWTLELGELRALVEEAGV
jgi:uncharacterized protein YndB with AHSA1/START domain